MGRAMALGVAAVLVHACEGGGTGTARHDAKAAEAGCITGEEAREPAGDGTPSAELAADVEAVERYGAAHAEDWGGFQERAEPRPHLVVGFFENADAHAAALAATVPHPDRVMVFAALTPQQSEAVRGQIQHELGRSGDSPLRLAGLRTRPGFTFPVLSVELAASAEDVAADLHRRFGESIELTVGTKPYPPPRPDAAPRCCARLAGDEAPPGMALRLTLDTPTLVAGQDGRGTLVVRNAGRTPLAVETEQPLVAVVTRPAGMCAVAGFRGALAGTGAGGVLAPGEEMELAVLFQTAAIRPEDGYALSPGEYEVRARLPLWEPGADGHDPSGVLSPPARLEVVASG
jgi:hypothetical protein